MMASPIPFDRSKAPATEPADWRLNLERRGSRILGDERNLLMALRIAPELRYLLRFDEFADRVEFAMPPPWRHARIGDLWTDEDDLKLQVWLQQHGVDVRNRAILGDCVASVARDQRVHPVRDYLAAVGWDRKPRLATWLAVYLRAGGVPQYLATVGRRFLVSAVARVMEPGCKVDHVLVLEGPQGVGKSRTVRTLGEPWTRDSIPDLHSTEAAIYMAGAWLIEISELAAERRSKVEAMKSFLSRQEDTYRPLYSRRTVSVPRQSVFIATTNESSYLRDPTGNRRFWPVKCGQVDLDGLERDRDQIWAEAKHEYDVGAMWHLTAAEEILVEPEQRDRVLATELEHDVAAYVDSLRQLGRGEVEVRDVLVDVLHLDPTRADYHERARKHGSEVAAALDRAGCRKVRRAGKGSNRRTVYTLHQESPSDQQHESSAVP